ncbi:cytochrome b/b6 domain-containing protein [Methylicorpusculum oleiharenae]|uniref:cytochrome b/b6 domain-containing protein n=1 Tax=Methylicorpusculum oleiharenae TaxID=1338687 RepID=UPI0013592FE6|nr:cytochrome b/b6 domain-containing protein [Methylicorpusculum oleiharenae]MCD2452346.1 cytochrome b/b6 domain-containing protein [Methylicorpusculum oleiharenae]
MQDKIKVWDLPVRLFHWLLVLSFFIAYLTEEEFLTPHVYAGYVVIGLMVFRFIWGFTGSRFARFSSFICSPAASLAYLKDLATLKAKRYIGHNPAGSAMILLLFISLLMLCISGLAVYAAEEHAGPLARFAISQGDFWEEIHEFFANFTLFLVVLHVAGVIVESRLHGESLVKSMLTGYKFIKTKSEQ